MILLNAYIVVFLFYLVIFRFLMIVAESLGGTIDLFPPTLTRIVEYARDTRMLFGYVLVILIPETRWIIDLLLPLYLPQLPFFIFLFLLELLAFLLMAHIVYIYALLFRIIDPKTGDLQKSMEESL